MQTQGHSSPQPAPPVQPVHPPGPPEKRADRRKSTREAAIDFVCRLDVCLSFFFFLFLVCVGVITTSITQTKISASLVDDLHSVHSVRVAVVQKGMDLLTERSFSMAAGFLSLHSQKGFLLRSEVTLSQLCSILTAFDHSKDFKSLAVTSLAQKEAISCMHGDEKLGSKAQLYGWITTNSIIPGVYLVNSSTFMFDRPLKPVYGGWPTSVYNLSETYDNLLAGNPAFTEASAYYNGTIKYIDYRTLWRAFPTIPHIIYCNIPASFLFRGLNLPPHINVMDYVDVRVDGSTLLTTSNAASATGITAAIFINASLEDDDPLVMSDNWGQASVNDTEILTTYEEGQVTYLRVSNISDHLMRAALGHVNLKELYTEGYSHTVDFQFDGAPATVTATTYTTKRGLILPMVLVSSHAAIALPYRRIMNICNGVNAVVILLITAFFWWFIKHHLHDPLQRISTLLLISVRRGTRALFHPNRHDIIALTEVHELGDAHNDAMRQLREIDTFIPEAVRQDILHGNTRKLSSAARSINSASLRNSLRAHARLLLTHLSTVVYITIRPSSAAHQSNIEATLRADTNALPERKRLAAVVENAARAGEGANTWPFPTSASLGVFAEKVHELCEQHHGTVHRLCPDSCILHFNKAVRGHLLVSCNATMRYDNAAAQEPRVETEQEGAQRKRDEVRASEQDAKDAMAFALALQEWTHTLPTCSIPDVRLLVDTSTFTCGHYRAHGSDNTLSVALGRDVQREVGSLPAKIGVRIAMTEETATRVRAGGWNAATGEIEPGVRQLPVDAVRTGRVGLDADVVVLYEALPGPALNDEPWQHYQRCCFDGFSLMVHGEYLAALQAFKQVADISDLEPGLMPPSLHREAASSSVTGGAKSVQVERLMRQCMQQLLKHSTGGYHRARHCPLGIDAVLKDAARCSSSSPVRSRNQVTTHPRDTEASVAQREGHYGVDGPNATFTRTELRYVALLPDSQIRTSYTGRPESITDNWGVKWNVAKKLTPDRGREMHNSLYSGLSEAGDLCALTLILFREVPPLVSKVLHDAPAGVMMEAMRSAVPVWQPTPAQRAAVRTLFDARLRLRHPHVLTCLGYSLELEGGVMSALEYCKGGNLREVMARYDRLRAPTVSRTALSILLGLRFLHANGIVHGELRPECVLVCSDGVCRLKGFYTDYALAHRVLCLPRTCYVSPEVAAGQPPTPASDVFGYGLVMLEVLTRERPWAWAPVAGEGPQRSAAELEELMVAGGQAFSDLVAKRQVVVALHECESAKIRAIVPPVSLDRLRSCVEWNPEDRPTMGDLLAHAERVAARNGVFLEKDAEVSPSSSKDMSDGATSD
jgi:hypothetical protein